MRFTFFSFTATTVLGFCCCLSTLLLSTSFILQPTSSLPHPPSAGAKGRKLRPIPSQIPLIPPRDTDEFSSYSPTDRKFIGSPMSIVKTVTFKSSYLVAPVLLVYALQSPAIHALPPLSPSALSTDLRSTAICAALATIWLKVVTKLAVTSRITANDARKIIHTGSAPLFMLFWPLFSAESETSRLLAACVPLANMLKLLSAGMSTDASTDEADKELAAAVSRTGEAKEALGGPFIYTIVLLLATALLFEDCSAGVVAVAQMAAGDGVADLVGRR